MIEKPKISDLLRSQRGTEHKLILPKPYARWQEELINSNVKLAVFSLGTKTGKTIGASIRIARSSFVAPREQDPYYRILAPYYRHSEITYKYLNRLIPERIPYDQNLTREQNEMAQLSWEAFTLRRSESKRRLIWPHNGATIECVHGQDPAAIEGERCAGVFIDEAAKLKEASFAASLTTTSQTGGWTFLTSTPVGKNFFYKIAMECADEEEMAKKRGRPPTKIFRTIPTWSSPFVNDEIIENARKTMPNRLFRQLYGGEFVDDGFVFSGLSYAFGDAIDFEEVDFWMVETHDSDAIFVGADWAKTNDWTVFTALDKEGRLIGFKRLQKLDYVIQVGHLYAFVESLHSRATVSTSVYVLHDKTGVGSAIDDIINNKTSDKIYDIKGIEWNNSNKEVFVNDLILSTEQKLLRFPPIYRIRHEMQIFDVSTSKTGRPIYSSPEGEHDDVVMSLVLSNALFRELRNFSTNVGLVNSLASTIEYVYYTVDDLDELY
jgi:hypothetical protein